MKPTLSIAAFLCCGCFVLSVGGGWWLYVRGVETGRRLAAADDPAPFQTNDNEDANPPATHRVTPGEFERQEALLIAWPGPHHPFVLAQPPNRRSHVFAAVNRVFMDIISASHQSILIVCLITDESTRGRVQKLLRSAGIPLASVQILRTSTADLWARDYGPFTVKTSAGSHLLVKGEYKAKGRLAGSNDAPSMLAQRYGLHLEHVPLNFEGGNLLSNGAGLCLTTTALIDWNKERYPSYAEAVESVTDNVRRHFGAKQVVFLKPLTSDNTGHVDVFAAFTSPDTVVVSQASSQSDPINAKILDENANRLSRVVTACGPLQVHRIPFPPPSSHGGQRRCAASFTNVVFANGVLLVPRYSDVAPQLHRRAMRTYEKLLPSWRVVAVDADVLKIHCGSLHCAVSNLFRIHNLSVQSQ